MKKARARSAGEAGQNQSGRLIGSPAPIAQDSPPVIEKAEVELVLRRAYRIRFDESDLAGDLCTRVAFVLRRRFPALMGMSLAEVEGLIADLCQREIEDAVEGSAQSALRGTLQDIAIDLELDL